MDRLPHHTPAPILRRLHLSLVGVYAALLVFFLVLGTWLALDLRQGRAKVLADTSQRAVQRSQVISHAFRTQVLVTDYVLRDVLGRLQASDLVFPNPDPQHALQVTTLLKEKAETVSDFFSMVVFDRNCVFTATPSGKNVGVKSNAALCEARKLHQGNGPLVSYVSGATSASGQSVLVLSRHLVSPSGEFLGGVLGIIELERAQHWFSAVNLSPGQTVALLDDAQVLLARSPLEQQKLGKPVTTPDTPAALRSAASGSSAATQTDMDGHTRLFGFSKVEGFPFTVAYGFDKQKTLEEWQRRAVELVAGYGLLLLLAFGVAKSYWTTLQQREALRASEAHFRMLAENMADMVWKADSDLRFTYINQADQRIRGLEREKVIGSLLRDNLAPQGQRILDTLLQQRREMEVLGQKGRALKYELPMRHEDGSEVWIEMSSVPVYGSDDSITGYQGVGRDVSGRRQQEARLLQSHQHMEQQLHQATQEKSALQEIATHDPLTTLYNRRFLDAALPRELARAEREHQPFAVVMLDLDHFKAVNDHYGHAAGDKVLQTLAKMLKKAARESDLICRYGGEEFVAVLSNLSEHQAIERVEAWRQQLEETLIVVGEFNIRVTLSAGIALYPAHGTHPSQLLARADKMLYRSKNKGRNRVSA